MGRKMNALLCHSGAWVIATLVTYTLGSIFMSQAVLARVSRFGVEVEFPARLQSTLSDLVGLLTSYLPLIAVAMAVAMFLATVLGRLLPPWRRALYLLAGTTAAPALVMIMTLTFGMNPLAGSQGLVGLGLQALAGFAGAMAYVAVLGKTGQTHAA
jgi:hypothetical protein